MEHAGPLLALATVFGLFMAWGIGANDVANAMGTSVGARVLTLRKAVVVAAIFEFAGAVLAGGQVTSTIRKGIIDSATISGSPELLVYGMLAALLAAGAWLLIASHFGWPVSTTHSIVGAIVGFAAVGIGIDAVKWAKVVTIVASWVVSPLLAGTIAFMLFWSVRRLVLDTADAFAAAQRWVPFYMFLVGFVVALVTLLKGLKHVGLDLSNGHSLLIAFSFGLLIALVGAVMVRRVHPDTRSEDRSQHPAVERVFGLLMVVTACSMAFAHGSNDVANAIGPVAAVVGVVTSGEIARQSALPLWVLLIGGAGIVIGLATYGQRVMATIGKRLTELTPSRGFAAELAAASTVVLASGTGLPVSTTHTLVGAVLGVGFARGIGAIDFRVVRTVVVSWLVTLPAGAGLAIVFFVALRGVFG